MTSPVARVTNGSAILCGCFYTRKGSTTVKEVGVLHTKSSVHLSDIQAVRKHRNDSITRTTSEMAPTKGRRRAPRNAGGVRGQRSDDFIVQDGAYANSGGDRD